METIVAVFAAVLAALAVATPVRAEDRTIAPSLWRSPPVQGLRDCPNGGIVLPGSDACLHLSGSVAAETTLRSGRPDARPSVRESLTRPSTTARLTMDVRLPTELGPLRVYSSMRMRNAGPDAPSR